jgi:hypothetical protein
MSLQSAVSDRHAIGGNKAPSGLGVQLAKDYEQLAQSIQTLADRANAAPKEIEDDAAVASVSDLVKDIAATAKRAEAARVAEKEPHLQAGREVDGFFKGLNDRLGKMKSALEQRVTIFLRAKAEAERRAREEQERVAREKAEEQLKLATQAETPREADKALDQALAAESVAEDAKADSQAKSADLARTRSDTGTLSTLRETWEFEITDFDAIPIEKLRPYFARADVEKAIRGFVRVGNRELVGTRIFKQANAVIR